MKAFGVLLCVLSVILVTSPAFAVGFEGLNFTGEPYITFDPASVSFFLTAAEIHLGDLEGWVKWKLNLSNASWEIVAADLWSNVHGVTTASGEFVYDSQRRVLIVEVENTDFLGCGFNPGVQVWFVSSLTSTKLTMSNPLDEENNELTLTRAGAGSGILGTWNAAVESNTFSITFNGDGTFTGMANIVQCD